VHETYIPDSTIRSDKPPSLQSLPLYALKQDNVWKPPTSNIWFLNSSGCDYFTCCAIAYSCWSKVWIGGQQILVFVWNSYFSPHDRVSKNASATSATFRYLDIFLHDVDLMLQNIRSERDGLWSLHLGLWYICILLQINLSEFS
jgi:hypothetical protein